MAGRVLINTGEGKGKTTAAIGTALRALGHGQRVVVFQFMKGQIDSGEVAMLERLGAAIHRLGKGFSWTKESWDEDRQLALEGWREAANALQDPTIGLVVLDEINYVIGYGLLDPQTIAQAIQNRPPKMNVILTGRGLHKPLDQLADTITEMLPRKHAFNAGVKAAKGVEF
ncbi:cob(I)alamin adenosyltransferase [Desulfarculus baarsii DSM 2075]|uniref:corrinoid adenosyltransferase n=1 Tax=Desulfarculus baarsii (strain ATCC 33931 / DSM 2075 / LMG 7858 / VKM B-1802 / 2st14) TaxID=644282 RepID=E1QFA4_DESB2|nr:cob(I)yrinic acid a,c-diamide adenosyltransferase [Desulfarculus baarsii]ADK84240.1 cob(I)alamin adenosyltransferase [Desulfarculus baarsii DSM 2075]